MIPHLREAFNSKYTEALYAETQAALEARAGCSVPFRLAETPLFLPKEFAAHAGRMAEEIMLRAATPELQEVGITAVPTAYDVAGDSDHPLFSAVDFAITGTPEVPTLGLIELQGFPSLFHFQAAYSEALRDAYGFDTHLNGLLYPDNGYGPYHDALRDAIVGDNDPSEVVLLELDPFNQKTLPDFLLAKQQLGIEIVNIMDVRADGRSLYHIDASGNRHAIKRIYNRAIYDEIEKKQIVMPFDVSKEYDVTWAGHPNWYYRISKVLLPMLVGTNEAVPNAFYASDPRANEIDISKYVLKPLYSFAGAGVNVHPTREDLERIPMSDRDFWLLQERVQYAEAFLAPDGKPVKVELRVMLLWPDNAAAPKAMHTLIRMTRGAMVGVDHNRGMSFVGSSCALVG